MCAYVKHEKLSTDGSGDGGLVSSKQALAQSTPPSPAASLPSELSPSHHTNVDIQFSSLTLCL